MVFKLCHLGTLGFHNGTSENTESSPGQLPPLAQHGATIKEEQNMSLQNMYFGILIILN